MKEQMEAAGYLVKIYRSHDKCSRALDKKPTVSTLNVFVVSEADAEPMLGYLKGRGCTDLRVVVDADGSGDGCSALELTEKFVGKQETGEVSVAATWEEVLEHMSRMHMEPAADAFPVGGYPSGAVAVPVLAGAPAGVPPPFGALGDDSLIMPPPALEAPDASYGVSATSAADGAGGNQWTLVWISDQAFKPAAVSLKGQLEALGCQVKGYKTHRNAARALDKKRALVRTVVLVSGAEAPAFIAYLASRPEIASTQIVVEASSRTVPVREGPTCQVAESFEDAVMLVRNMVSAGVDATVWC